MKFVILMSIPDVILLHDMAIERFGGRPGMRDVGLLESALYQPIMMLDFGEQEEQEIYHLGAAYFFHIIKNHSFVDGNKRAGLLTTLEFFARNGFEVTIGFDELYQIALYTAESRLTKKEIAMLFKEALQLL